MADIQMSNKGKRKSSAPRIDLTPMVDLGFILITFFIFTTTITKSHMMDINMPDNSVTQSHTAFPDTSTITIILTKKNNALYYSGVLEPGNMKRTSLASLSNLLKDKQQALKKLPSTFTKEAHKVHVIIKPGDDCVYSDVVNILDQIAINDISYYAIADLCDAEKTEARKLD